jgi:DNA-binding response OmpR family regulator
MTSPCCMIVEDQALIGISLEAFLEEAGFSVAGPFLSCADALRWLEHNTPHVAVLDVRLRDGTRDCSPARVIGGAGTLT